MNRITYQPTGVYRAISKQPSLLYTKENHALCEKDKKKKNAVMLGSIAAVLLTIPLIIEAKNRKNFREDMALKERLEKFNWPSKTIIKAKGAKYAEKFFDIKDHIAKFFENNFFNY